MPVHDWAGERNLLHGRVSCRVGWRLIRPAQVLKEPSLNAGVALENGIQTAPDDSRRPLSTEVFRIDTHQHFFPPCLAGASSNPKDLLHLQTWSPSRAIDMMDEHQIATAIVSAPPISMFRDDFSQACALARESNEFGTRMKQDFSGRFGLFASIPLFDVDGALGEADYAFDCLQADGICLVTSYRDKWPGDPSFLPVFEELNRRKAVVFFHPVAPAYSSSLSVGIQPGALEFVFDTTRAIMSLMLNHTFAHCPDVRFIFAHGGGTLPWLRERIDYVVADEEDLTAKLPNGIGPSLRQLYFDVVLVSNRSNLSLMTDLVPPTHLLLGTDFPFVVPRHTIDELEGLGLERTLLQNIVRDNALRLFPHLALSR